MGTLVDDQEGVTYERGDADARSVTNTTPGSVKTCTLECRHLWSIEQMAAIAAHAENNKLLPQAIRRAKRTAGNYAALFLGDEGTDQAGRFYWPGLAAFAAKQVFAGIEYANANIDFANLNPRSKVGQARMAASNTFYYLLKGNFWVFIEVVPWMTYYKRHGSESFDCCVDQRDVTTYDAPTRRHMRALPWATGKNTALQRSLQSRVAPLAQVDLSGDGVDISRYRIRDRVGALAEVDNCTATQPLRAGFAQMKVAANMPENKKENKQKALYKSAESFLSHEQILRLQPLVYDHPEFQNAIDLNDLFRQSWIAWLPLGARTPELVFNDAPALTDEIIENELEPAGLAPDDVTESMSPEDGKLYNEAERMKYVDRILKAYHKLMVEYREYMIDQLNAIERWRNA